jgi:hypothetical protein
MLAAVTAEQLLRAIGNERAVLWEELGKSQILQTLQFM